MLGDARRGEVQNPLGNTSDLRQGVGLSTPVQVTGVQRPAQINVQPVSTQVMDELAQWGGAAIRKQATKQMNKSMLEGQMAYQQGQAFEQIETGGDKFMMEGYHVMEAQTMSAQLLAAQQAEIQNAGYALSPEQFRQQYMDRADAMLDGKDPRVQELVRQTMTEQLPSLVQNHTSANAAYSVQRTFDAGVTAIATLSQDTTGDAALLQIADAGPNSPLAGLGPVERQAAVAGGIVYAFQQNNPAAYIKLKAAGKLAELTPDQQAQVENARKAYQQNIRQTYSADRTAAFDEFYTKLDNGDFASPMEATQAANGLYEQFGMEMDNSEGWQVMTAARTGISAKQQSVYNNVETALVANDYAQAAMLAAPALVQMESGGRYNAMGPIVNGDRAYGKYQVMGNNIPSWTKNALGRAMTPQEFLNDPDAQDAVFAYQFGGYLEKASKAGKPPALAMQDAVSMWHSGRDYETAVEAGAFDGNMSTKDYTDKIMGAMTGQTVSQARLALSSANTDYARQEQEMRDYEQLAPARNALDQQFMAGKVSEADWRSQRSAMYEQFNTARTTATVDQEISISNAALENAAQAAAAAGKEQQAMAVQEVAAKVGAAEMQMNSVLNNPDATLVEKQMAIKTYAGVRNTAWANSGLPPSQMPSYEAQTAFSRDMGSVWQRAVEADRTATENMALVTNAAAAGALGTTAGLDKKATDKWWKQQVSRAQQDAATARAKDPKLTDADENGMVQQKIMQTMAESGYLPPGMKERYSAAIEGPLLDRNGNPNESAVSAISDYMLMNTLNPVTARQMLSPAALATAEQLAEMAGNDINGLSLAIQTKAAGEKLVPGAVSVADFNKSPEFQATIQDATNSFVGDKWYNVMNLFGPTNANENTWTPQMKQKFAFEVQRVAGNKYALTQGTGSVEAVVKAAVKDVASRTSIMQDGSILVSPPGIDLAAETFGSGLANFGGSPGAKNEMASSPETFDKAIRAYLWDQAKQDKARVDRGEMPTGNVPTRIAALWSETPTEANGFWETVGLPFVGIGKYATQGFEAVQPTLSAGLDYGLAAQMNPLGVYNATGRAFSEPPTEDEIRESYIDYDPTGFVQTKDGTFLRVTGTLADGETTWNTLVPLKQAGALYMNRHRK